MGFMEPIIECKDKVIQRILSSDKVVSLITGADDVKLPATSLLYKNVFPYAFLPDTVDEATNYVCVEGNIVNVRSDTAVDIELTIMVLSHVRIMRTDYGTKVDVLSDAIDELINHSRDFGIGKLVPADRYPTKWSIPNYDYVARQMTYYITGFNFRRGSGDYE